MPDFVIADLLDYARQNDCSDIHITPSQPPTFRRIGSLHVGPFPCSREQSRALIISLLNGMQGEQLALGDDLDFSYVSSQGLRYRINVYHCQGGLACAIRVLRDDIPSLADLQLPDVIRQLAEQPRGLILVTGPTGSGKSTTLAAVIDHINTTRKEHIITIEDPIEYLHSNKGCLVHQRELHRDVSSFAYALRSAMREDPDVILVGEMRDFETISAAVTAAETGHLVISTLHTTGAAQTIDRIVDVYPAQSQEMIRSQLSGILLGVITQTLVPTINNSGRIVATEILVGTNAVLNLIREGKCHQLASTMQSSGGVGMHTLASDLATLIRAGKVSLESALAVVNDRTELEQNLGIWQ